MGDDELLLFCEQNKGLRIERNASYQLSIMPPVFPYISNLNGKFNTELWLWSRNKKTGLTFGSNAGFYLPDTSMKSLDAAWISLERWDTLPNEKRKGFAYIAPDFIVELASLSDKITALKQKMEEWRDNGVQLGWLVIPQTETVFIYRIDGTVSKVEGFDNTLSGEDVLPSFEFKLEVLQSLTQ